MKNLAVVFALVASTSALAAGNVRTSTLTALDVDSQITSYNPKTQQMGGEISIDTQKNEATISVAMSARCEDTRPCPKYLIRVIGETLPITSVKADTNCGETIYTAELNRMPVDGAKMTLEITDNSTLVPGRCAFFRAPDPMTAVYKTEFEGRTGTVKTESSFVGTELK